MCRMRHHILYISVFQSVSHAIHDCVSHAMQLVSHAIHNSRQFQEQSDGSVVSHAIRRMHRMRFNLYRMRHIILQVPETDVMVVLYRMRYVRMYRIRYNLCRV